MPPRSPTTTANAEEDDVFGAVWGNPQAGNSQLSFSSAVRRNDATPSKRRRGSEGLAKRGRTDHDPWSSAEPPSPSASHSRSRTIDDEAGTGSYWMSGRSTSQHPLRHSSSHASSSSWTLDHGTRPGMRRALSGNDTDKGASEAGQGEGSVALDREMLVIIHEVQTKDSLAGVALKYGIALPELRRANQLWTSDSIHLRKVLYIPVDKTRQAIHLREALIDKNARSNDQPSPDPAPTSTDQPDSPPSVETSLPDIGKLTIRRVPASQLSYFPPPTHPPPMLESDRSRPTHTSATLPNGRPKRSRSALPSAFARSTDSPLQGILDVFTSSFQATANHARGYSSHAPGVFFGGPPVRAPAALATRLSLDSTSGTPSSTSDDLEWEHELEDVRVRRGTPGKDRSGGGSRSKVRREASASLNGLGATEPPVEQERDSVELEVRDRGARTPTHRRNSSSRSQASHTSPPGSGPRGRTGKVVPYAAADADAADEWGSPSKRGGGLEVVRTAQMAPSPGMQLPVMGQRKAVQVWEA